ncbi:hypothetical protein O181_001996 [Austropuccinia psidii MF-1]|uniref:Uncharacterized protein n=1 Tax=Austropuccinia psidii MF-1 TaxID=1389203 RepID=A0A9Q3GCX4_9BASI|nr:hypothetical protein [Austropuccinia psidii MF-1]
MEYIIRKKMIGKIGTRTPFDPNTIARISREDRRPERTVLKCHKCERTSNLTKTCTKEIKINEEVQGSEEKEEYYQYSKFFDETPGEDCHIENMTALFEFTEVHTHLTQYSGDCYNLINIQGARICKSKPSRGKGYTSGASCITSILINSE